MRQASKGAPFYLLAYLLWLASIAACLVAVIQLRAAIAALWTAFGGDRYTVSLVSQVSLLLASLAAFTYVMFLEGHYRESAGPRALLRRFAMTMAIPLGVIALSLVLLEVGLRAIR